MRSVSGAYVCGRLLVLRVMDHRMAVAGIAGIRMRWWPLRRSELGLGQFGWASWCLSVSRDYHMARHGHQACETRR